MVQFQIDGAANDFDPVAIHTHIGVLQEGHNAILANMNSHSDAWQDHAIRITTLENVSGNGNENGNGTSSSVHCHVDCGDFGNKTEPGAVLDAQWGWFLVPFSYTVEESTSGIYDFATGRFTPGVEGVYKVTAVVEVYFSNGGGAAALAALHKNNTLNHPTAEASTRIAMGVQSHSQTNDVNFHETVMHAYVDTIVTLTSTDYLQLFFRSQNAFNNRPSVRRITKLLMHKIG